MSRQNLLPVIIGVGQVNDRPGADEPGLDSAGLMLAALAVAEHDAGVSLLGRLDWLGIENQISWPDPAIDETVAAGLPARPGHVRLTADASGHGPMELLNRAANAIGRGEVRIAAITGGEALRTAAKRATGGGMANALAAAAEAGATPLARRYGLVTPADVYPLYENATRAAWRQSLAEAQTETAEIWSGLSKTAAENPNAWLRAPLTPSDILAEGPANRMISFPYTKLMVANSAVNQGAALILASLETALSLGIPRDRLVFVGAGAAAHEPADFLRRDGFTGSASLNASIDRTLALNGLVTGALDHVEFYSCFPCVPKMARRRLGWPADRPASVYGGLTFGGGPIGNCMTHAAAAMVEKLRMGPGNGLIVANGGYATHNHAIVLTSQAPGINPFPQDFDVQATADALRGPIPALLDDHTGPGTVESFTMPYGREGRPLGATIVARTQDGARFLAAVPVEDAQTLAWLAGVDPVGSAGSAEPMVDGRRRWVRGV
ncbi:hypothetical protein [Niveispirillum sp. KHB5.9]|uniref:hypothetical protein n=1 Tax=Niveispirillum sp. KHB5.9 TaxID=3400269 RepID=UPI003A87D72A